jgi:hypothetical protein
MREELDIMEQRFPQERILVRRIDRRTVESREYGKNTSVFR